MFSNDFTESVTFCIRNDDLGESRGSPFNLVPIHEADVEYRTKSIKAQLKQGQKLILKAKFAPKAPGTYKVDVPIFVKGYSNGIVYNYITLKGELKRPQLTPSSNEVSLLGTTKRKNFRFSLSHFSHAILDNFRYYQLHFPPLPLNIGCDVSISIVAENYETPDRISCLVWTPPDGGDATSRYLSITWLNEPVIISSREPQVFQALVNFCSPIPIALE